MVQITTIKTKQQTKHEKVIRLVDHAFFENQKVSG